MAEQHRKRTASKLYSRDEVLQAISDSSDYDDSDADPDYCLPKKSKDGGSDSDDSEFHNVDGGLSISVTPDAPSTSATTGTPSTSTTPDVPSTSATSGTPSTSMTPDPPSTSVARDAHSTSVSRDAHSTSVSRDAPSTSVARDAPSTSVARDAPSTSVARIAPSTSVACDAPSTSVAPDATSTSDISSVVPSERSGEKRQYSNTRKRQRNPDTWKKNVRKGDYNHGLEHVNTVGKIVSKRSPKAADCTKCRFKCTSSFDDNSREHICSTYWNLDFIRKKDFILSHLETENVKRDRARGDRKRNKTKSNSFYFRNETGDKIRVCKDFFLKTLCISHGPLMSAIKNRNEHGIFQGADNRGKHAPHNKISEEHADAIKNHIKSFPTMESHYTRASSKRLYLDPNLSIKKMHELFCVEFSKNNPGVKPPGLFVYRQIFCNDFNLNFFVPKKDQCMKCTKFKNLTGNAKIDFQEEYEDHLRRKTLSHVAKAHDKDKANSDPSFMSVTFDLQSVLQIPSCPASLTYYMRKLCVYNLTVYQQKKPSDAYCFTWQETAGKRGAIEIGTCIFEYLKTLPDTVNELSLWSDTCSGQNRNQYIAVMFLHALKSFPNLKKITHNYLESGHSSMEADSMHSSIESEKKNRMVFSMIDWISIFENARRRHPYKVKQFKHHEFLDFQQLAKSVMKNRTKDANGSKVNWLKVKRFQYRQEHPTTIFYSYDYSDDFGILDIRGVRPRSSTECETIWQLPSAYQQRLPISVLKKADLLKLCTEMVIPDELHAWFHDLPTSKQAREDSLPEPAATDSEDDDE